MADKRDPMLAAKAAEAAAMTPLAQEAGRNLRLAHGVSPDPSLTRPGAHNTPPVPEKNPIQFKDRVIKPKPTAKERQASKAASEGRLLDLSRKAAEQRQARTGTTSFSTGQPHILPETPTMAKIDQAKASQERKATRTAKAATKVPRVSATPSATSKVASKPTVPPSAASAKARGFAEEEMTSAVGKRAVAQAKNPRKHPSIDNDYSRPAQAPNTTAKPARVAPSAPAPPAAQSGNSDWIDAAISGAKAKAASTRKPRAAKATTPAAESKWSARPSTGPRPTKDIPAEPTTGPLPSGYSAPSPTRSGATTGPLPIGYSAPPPPKASSPGTPDRMSRSSVVDAINAGPKPSKPTSVTPASSGSSFETHENQALNLANSGTPRTGATPPRSSVSVRAEAASRGPTFTPVPRNVRASSGTDSGGFEADPEEAKSRRAVDVFRDSGPRPSTPSSGPSSEELTVHGTIPGRRGGESHAVVSHGGSNYSIPESQVRSLGSMDTSARPSASGFHNWALSAGGKHLGNFMPSNIDSSSVSDAPVPSSPAPPNRRASGPRYARPSVSAPQAEGTGPFPQARQALSEISTNRKASPARRALAGEFADLAMEGNKVPSGGLRSAVTKSRGSAHPLNLAVGGARALGRGIRAAAGSGPSLRENAQAFFHPATPVSRNLQPRQFPGGDE